MSETEQLVQRFITRTLPKPEWTHHVHLRVGLWHVVKHGPDEALALLRERISRYNESVGTINSDDSGYHETITAFYVRVIVAAIADQDPTASLDQLATLVIERCGARDYPLRFYSKERLCSIAARRGWVAPDRLPVPKVPSAKGAKGSVPTVPEVPKG